MSSVNKVILVGRLGKDPEIRSTNGGDSVANFSLATDETYKDRSGERQKKTEWHNIVVWGQAVESFVKPYLHRGDLVYIEGKLQTRSWEDKQNGGKRWTTEINVSDIKALQTGGNSEGSSKSSSQGSRASSSRSTGRTNRAPEIRDEDIPF